MCVAALGIVASIAQSVVSFGAAQADYNAKAQQYKQNFQNAISSGRDDQSQIQLRFLEEQQDATQKQQQNVIEGAEIGAEAENSAGAAGVAGISVNNILTGISRKVSQKVAADKTNYLNTVAQLGQKLKGTETTMQNQINSVQKPVKPNPLGFILQGVGGALKAAG